jgi:GDP-4-dehydro-6-deoxy-D-mannose reductase
LSTRVFLTGASGFVGRHLVEFLSGDEFELFGTCFPEKPDAFLGKKPVSWFHVDIKDEKKIANILKDVRPDWIFHLAAVSNVGYSWKNRRETLETNVLGTFAVFDAARNFSPGARILFVSSCDVYGILTPIESALTEEDKTPVVSPYAYTKISGEMLARFYSQIEGLDIIISRSFPHTGPGQTASFVFSDWACQIARIEKGEADPVLRVGNLDVRRDYSDVRDVVRAYRLLLEKGERGETYNVCSGEAISLKEALDRLVAYSEKEICVEVDPSKLRKADIPLLLGDNSKIRGEIGWAPEIPMDRTLKDLLDFWRA